MLPSMDPQSQSDGTALETMSLCTRVFSYVKSGYNSSTCLILCNMLWSLLRDYPVNVSICGCVSMDNEFLSEGILALDSKENFKKMVTNI